MDVGINWKICFMFLLCSLITVGCKDRIEVNDLAFVMATSIDMKDNGEYSVSVQIANTSAVSQSESSTSNSKGGHFVIATATGNNLTDLFPMIQEKISRKMSLTHMKIIILGERLAQHGIKDVLDHLGRDPESRLRVFLMVAKGGEARELLKKNYPLERVPAEAFRELQKLRFGSEITVRDFFMNSSNQGIDPIMASIQPVSNASDGKEGELVRLSGIAIFKKNKLVGYLNDEETNGFMWVVKNQRKGTVTAFVPEAAGRVSMILVKSTRKISTQIDKENVKINLDLKGVGTILENNTNLDLSQPQNLKLVEEALEKSIKTSVRHSLESAQKKYRADVFGFGKDIYQRQNKKWGLLKDEWEDIFSKALVTVNVDLNVSRTGMTGSPLQLKE